MTLIIILIALGLNLSVGGLRHFRNFNGFIALFYGLEKRLAKYKFWDGTMGLLLVLSLPLSVLLIVLCFSGSWFVEVGISLLVLMYCLAPKDLDKRLDGYIHAVKEDDSSRASSIADALIDKRIISDDDSSEISIIKSVLVGSHKHIFAVIFWFLVLGAVGALLYRLVNELHDALSENHSALSDSTTRLMNILEWPSSRLMVIGLALSGNLVNALPGWSKSEHLSFEVNNQVLINAGIGALQYLPDAEVPGRGKSYWIAELKSLINRTLIIWLAILGLMILSGTLS